MHMVDVENTVCVEHIVHIPSQCYTHHHVKDTENMRIHFVENTFYIVIHRTHSAYTLMQMMAPIYRPKILLDRPSQYQETVYRRGLLIFERFRV